ncbi:NAD(P)H-dependent flavin oxidoreductase [Phytoactinopolyspora limicola]|uniref:NAD(P)H-dependent flavin oxidoreductase n=1 Tax=Phytoactinopolyspora limicola TaxID=2715536 RepID=UPI0014080D53|nr:nitronate monooxygenase [Phytoactinopolyspora limicola]
MSLADVLNSELPIVQAPMAGVQGSELAAAVCDAGGLGSLPCATLGPDGIRAELTRITTLTNGPYNVNFFCHTAPPPDAERDKAWRLRLRPYYEELGLDPDARPSGPTRSPFDADAADVLDEFRPPVVSFHFGLPSVELLARVKAWGSTVLASATTIDEARWLHDGGADVIIAQGLEAGGHRGMFLTDDLTTQVSTLTLVPQVVAAVDVPVIASGGIADARAVAAALALGAEGVQVGTAYLRCPEATTSPVHRAALASEDSRHTALTNVFSGRPARGLVNRAMRELGAMRDDVPAFPLASAAVAPLRAAAEAQGRGDFSWMWAGQNTSGCREVGAGEITRDLAAGLP